MNIVYLFLFLSRNSKNQMDLYLNLQCLGTYSIFILVDHVSIKKDAISETILILSLCFCCLFLRYKAFFGLLNLIFCNKGSMFWHDFMKYYEIFAYCHVTYKTTPMSYTEWLIENTKHTIKIPLFNGKRGFKMGGY